MPSLYRLHVERWKDCTGCDLHRGRKRVVLARGTVPCDILFTGESPGESEDVLGKPFVGPAGHLLDQIIKNAVPAHLTYALTNLVCCIPRDKHNRKASEPDEEYVHACSERLVEFASIADAKLLVMVGKLAKTYLEPGYKHSIAFARQIPWVHVNHPSFILRSNITQRGLLVQQATVQLADAVEEVFGGNEK